MLEVTGGQKLQWSVPRELLWAVILGLAVFVAALWPSQYPYRQAPELNSHQQVQNSLNNNNPTSRDSATELNRAQQTRHGGEHVSEITILGVKPGEWLLSIVTLMLWGATVGLVRGAEVTAARQLRAYVSIELAGQADFRRDPANNFICAIPYKIKNTGQTPAFDVQAHINFHFRPQPLAEDLPRPKNPVPNSQFIVPDSFYVGTAVKTFAPETLPANPTDKLYIIGLVTYRDSFGVERETWICSSMNETGQILAYRIGQTAKAIRTTFSGANRQNYGT